MEDDVMSKHVLGGGDLLPRLKHVSVTEKEDLFIRKLYSCSLTCDPSESLVDNYFKKETLKKLVDYVVLDAEDNFSDTVMQAVVKMVSANLFRAASVINVDALAWPHIVFVYEFLSKFVESPLTVSDSASRFVNRSFVSNLLNLLNSKHWGERRLLTKVLREIYKKFSMHQSLIRNTIHDIVYRFVYESHSHNGIGDLVWFFDDKTLPPQQEVEKCFLVTILIQLHKPECVAKYHSILTTRIKHLLEKDSKLTDSIVRGILRYWPLANSLKEEKLINEVREVLGATQLEEFQKFMGPLSRRIACCLTSLNSKVVQSALSLLSNRHIGCLISENKQVLLPIFLPALKKTARNHWEIRVREKARAIEKNFSEMVPSRKLRSVNEVAQRVKTLQYHNVSQRIIADNLLKFIMVTDIVPKFFIFLVKRKFEK